MPAGAPPHRRAEDHGFTIAVSRRRSPSFADERNNFSLAVSLHGATDEVRNKIMPVNLKYPLGNWTAALDYYQSNGEHHHV